jgi:hypothetical protein
VSGTSFQRRAARTGLAGALLMTGAAAAASTTTYVDLEAGLGASSNPFLQIPSRSSAFGRLSAFGFQGWNTERGTTSLTGYVEDTSYFKDFGSKQIFDLGAHTRQRMSPTVTVFGDLGFSGDFSGQLSNRLLFVPSQPPVPEPGNPLPPTTNNPDLFGLNSREYRASAQLGASIQTSPIGSVSLSAGAQRIWFTGKNSDANYNSYFASGGYSQQVSERTSVGATVYLQRQDFRHGDWANIVNPVLTVHTQLSESLTGDAAVGLMAIQQRTGDGKDHNVTPSFSAGLCDTATLSHWCVHVSRDAQSALSARVANGSGQAAITTSASFDYYRRLSENGTLQASITGVHFSSTSNFNNINNNLRTTYVSGVVGYDRKVGHRLFAGVSGGVRKLFQDGPDPNLDFNANLYLRYRLGDLL